MLVPRYDPTKESTKESTRQSNYALSVMRKEAEKQTLILRVMMDDLQIKERRQAGMCKSCHYTPRGYFIPCHSERQCGICEILVAPWVGRLPLICVSCAVEHQLCTLCGADIEGHTRRMNFKFLKVRQPDLAP